LIALATEPTDPTRAMGPQTRLSAKVPSRKPVARGRTRGSQCTGFGEAASRIISANRGCDSLHPQYLEELV